MPMEKTPSIQNKAIGENTMFFQDATRRPMCLEVLGKNPQHSNPKDSLLSVSPLTKNFKNP